MFNRALRTLGLVSLVLVFASCGKIDPDDLNGYWTVSEVKTRGMGSNSARHEWPVTEGGYVMGIQGQNVSFLSYGTGLQQLDLGGSNNGQAYSLDGDQIMMGKAQAIHIEEANQKRMVLSQEVNDPQDGKLQVTHELNRLEPFQVKQILQSRHESIPPELEAGFNGYGGRTAGYPSKNPSFQNPQNGNGYSQPPQTIPQTTPGFQQNPYGQQPIQQVPPQPVQQQPGFNPNGSGYNPAPSNQVPNSTFYNQGFTVSPQFPR